MATGISYKVTPGVGSIKIEIKATSFAIENVSGFEFFCRLDLEGATATTSGKTVNSVYTFDRLKNGTRYAVNVKIFYKDGSWEFLGTETVYTLTDVKISEIATGDTYCILQLINLDPNYGTNDRTVYWTFQADGDTEVKTIGPFALNSNISKSDKYTIDGLDPGIDYTVCAVIYYNGGSVVLDTVTITTQATDEEVLVSLDDTILTIENYNSKHTYQLYCYETLDEAENKTENPMGLIYGGTYDLKQILYNSNDECTYYYRVYNQTTNVYSGIISYTFPGWIEDFSITVGGTLLRINDYDQDSYYYTCYFYNSDIEAKNNIMNPMGTATMDQQTFDLTELVFSPEEYEQLKNTTFWVRVYREPKAGGLDTYSNVGKFTFGVESAGAIVVEEIGGKYVKVSLFGCSLGQGSKRTVQWMMRPTESNKEYKQYGISNNVAGVITLTGLEENTSYYIVAVVSEEGGNQLGTAGPITITTTKSAKAEIELVENGIAEDGTRYVTVQLINLDTSYAGSKRTVYWQFELVYTGVTIEKTCVLENGQPNSPKVTLDRRVGGILHSIRAFVYNEDTHPYSGGIPLSIIGPIKVTTISESELAGVDYELTSTDNTITINITGKVDTNQISYIRYSCGLDSLSLTHKEVTDIKQIEKLTYTFSNNLNPDTRYLVRVRVVLNNVQYELGDKYIKTKPDNEVEIRVYCSDYTSGNGRLRKMSTLGGVDTLSCGIVWEIYSNNSYQRIWQKECYPESQQIWSYSIPLNITGLTENTTYTVYAQLIEDLNGNGKKDSGEYSQSFGPVTFTTMNDEGCGWATIKITDVTTSQITCGLYIPYEYRYKNGLFGKYVDWEIREIDSTEWDGPSFKSHSISETSDDKCDSVTFGIDYVQPNKKYLIRANIIMDVDDASRDETTNAIEAMLLLSLNWTDKISGQPFDLTKEEWDALTAYIDSVYINKKGSSYGFTEITQGDTFTYNIYNDAFDAIAELGGNLIDGNTQYTRAYKNKPITAGCLNILAKAIKEIQ